MLLMVICKFAIAVAATTSNRNSHTTIVVWEVELFEMQHKVSNLE
jgi:hypothetical protein